MTSYVTELRGLIGNRLLLLPSVAAIIHDHAGNLLLQEKASGEGWSLPAGAIEPGETPQEAIIREVAEETGFVVSSTSILGVFGGRDFRYTYPNGHSVEYVVTLFKCQVLQSRGRGRIPRRSRYDISPRTTCHRSHSLILSRRYSLRNFH
jgi:8-oxo-dGTP pyrophosphatase MutT (NUDIX family)